jgi:hypothetical protein
VKHEAVIEYICPRCGAQIPVDERRCPGCHAMLDWLEEHKAPAPEEGPDDASAPDGAVALGEEAPPDEGEVPAEQAPTEHAPAEQAPPTGQTTAEQAAAEHAPAEHAPAEHAPAEHAPAEHAPAEHAPAEHAPAEVVARQAGGGWEELAVREGARPDAARPEAASRPFGFLYSNIGAISFAVMLVAFVGTMLVLRWDTWIGGADVETIGRLQLAVASAGIATIIVTGSLGVWDALRGSRA